MSKRVLVIDDELDIRDVVCIAIEEFSDWQAESAGSGQEGLKKAASGHWDVILLDVSMPDMDGLAVFKALQANPKTQHIPVILLTAKVMTSELVNFCAEGGAGVIRKPFDPIHIWQEMATMLGWPT